MKIALDFDVLLNDLDGKPVPDQNMGKYLATALATQSDGDIIKLYDWAVALHKGERLELDAADCNTLKRFIETNRTLTVLCKRQLLAILENAVKS